MSDTQKFVGARDTGIMGRLSKRGVKHSDPASEVKEFSKVGRACFPLGSLYQNLLGVRTSHFQITQFVLPHSAATLF